MTASDTRTTIAKNAGFLMVSQVVTWGLTLLLTIFLPRYLGAAGVGKFHLADSVWAIMAIVTSFGMDALLTKEIARDPERSDALFSSTIVLRFLLYLLSFGLVALYARIAGYPLTTIYVFYVVGIGNLFWQFIGACQATLQGLERMEYISAGMVAGKLFNTVVSIILLLRGYGVVVIAAVTVGAAIVTLIIQFFFLNRLITLHFRPSWEMMWWMLRTAVPYLLGEVFLVIYMQIDIVIISLLVNETVVGWYGAADRLFGTLLFVPTVFMTAVFPVLSRMYTDNADALPRLMQKSFTFLLLLALPLGLGVLVIARPLVVLLFGDEFAGSGPVLAVMGIVLILTYQNMLLGKFMVSVDRQKTWAVVLAVATAATLPLDLLLIPWCQEQFGNGAIGGALAFVVTESLMLVAGLALLPQTPLDREHLWMAARALLAALLMALVVWWLRDYFVLLPIAAGAVVYVALVLLLRIVPSEDWEMAGQLWQQVQDKVRGSEPEPAGS